MSAIVEQWPNWARAGVRVWAVQTWEEAEVWHRAQDLSERLGLDLWRWSAVSGLVRPGDALSGALTRDVETFLDRLLALPAGVVVAADLWNEPLSARAVRQIRELAESPSLVLLLATSPPGAEVPASLAQSVVNVSVGSGWGARFRSWLEGPDPGLRRALERQEVTTAGLAVVAGDGGWDQVGGLSGLKGWAKTRRLALDPESALPFPRGVLLYGIPGTGKSLSVKAWAHDWQLPLLRLDWAALMGRFVGQSEGRLSLALAAVERIAPAILWVDEIDKAFGDPGQAEDSGVTRRLVGMLLTWMQEHDAPVLLVATANQVQGLPAELLRPGRFDRLFFVDLPDREARAEILRIHLRRQSILPNPELVAVADELEQFSGADIAQLVVEARFLAAERHRSLTADLLNESARQVIPWAHTLTEELNARRVWARHRLHLA